MPTNFGVYVDDDLADAIEQRRVRTTDGQQEIRSRSEVIGELLRIGIAADEIISDSDLDLDPGRPREAFVRQAVINQLDDEGFDTGGL